MNILRCVCVGAMLAAGAARADVVTDWNTRACDFIVAAKVPPPVANRVLAYMHSASYAAAAALARQPLSGALAAAAGSPPQGLGAESVAGAIASANREVLLKLIPAQAQAIEGAYRESTAGLPAGKVRDAAADYGAQVARRLFAARADDVIAKEAYRPAATAGVYVPTTLPAVPFWPQRVPWLMDRASQFRPGPPPALTSERWARDFNEIKSLGRLEGSSRSVAQTAAAHFWEATLPAIYFGVVRSVATQPGRDVLRNARLYAAVSEAMDDALIAVFDAKYTYNFWRPITAIRNGDLDGNDATTREPAWTPFIDTPMHPEYPCAHCIVSATVATVLAAELGSAPVPRLSSASYLDKGLTRSWDSLEEFAREVSEARVCDGVHFRFSTETGADMGRKVGALAVARYLAQP